MDNARIHYLPLPTPEHRTESNSSTYTAAGAGIFEMGFGDVVVDGGYAVVFWASLDRSRISLDGGTMRVDQDRRGQERNGRGEGAFYGGGMQVGWREMEGRT